MPLEIIVVFHLSRKIALQSDFRPLIQHPASASFPIPVNPGHKNHPRQLCASAEHCTVGQRDSPSHLSLLPSIKQMTLRCWKRRVNRREPAPTCRAFPVSGTGLCRFHLCISSSVGSSSKAQNMRPL